MTGVGAAARANGDDLDDLRQAKLKEFATDHRHSLYREYLRIVAAHEPAVFVMENVKGILSSKLRDKEGKLSGLVFEQIRRGAPSDPKTALADDVSSTEAMERSSGHKYRLYSLVIGGGRSDGELRHREFIIRAEDYGVPQKRHRVILLGVRDDIQAKPRALRPSERASVRDAVGDLPSLRSKVSKNHTDDPAWRATIRAEGAGMWTALPPAIRHVIERSTSSEGAALDSGANFVVGQRSAPNSDLGRWYHDARLGGVTQHEARSHMRSDLARYLFVAASAEVNGSSPKLQDWPSELLPDHRNVAYDPETKSVVASGFSDRFKVQVWPQPSSTITSHISKDGHYFIHPDPRQCRSLTVREAARLQTFPDNYFFCGNRTQQYHQVGNAVPPFLASQIAGVVAELLDGER